MRPKLFCAMLFALTVAGASAPAAEAAQAGPIVVAQAPGGAGCTATIARYRAIAKADADTGNANASVYKQIDREIGNAEAACAAGRDAEAQRLIASSKVRHGYPSGN